MKLNICPYNPTERNKQLTTRNEHLSLRTKNQNILNYKYLYLALFSTLLIIYASSIPDQALLVDDSLIEQIISNLAHIPAYALLTFLWLKAFERRSASYSFMAVALILFVVSDEIHQSFIPGRFASFTDISLDFLGILFGLVTFKVFKTFTIFQGH